MTFAEHDLEKHDVVWDDSIKPNAIAAEQMTVLQKYQGPREKPLRIIDVREKFRQMPNEL